MSELLTAEMQDFVIDSDAKAEWALRKIREAREDRDTWVNWYKQKIQEITEQTDFNTMNLERMLREYFDTVPHRKTKTQESYKLPGGKLFVRIQNPEYKRDDDTVIEWAEKNGLTQYIKIEKKLAWAELKEATGIFDGHIVTEDGEIVPGIEVINREPEFKVEV